MVAQTVKNSCVKQTPFVYKVRKKCHLFHKVAGWVKEKHGVEKKNSMCKKVIKAGMLCTCFPCKYIHSSQVRSRNHTAHYNNFYSLVTQVKTD